MASIADQRSTKKKQVPLPDDYLNENLADIDDQFGLAKKKSSGFHSKSRSVLVNEDGANIG